MTGRLMAEQWRSFSESVLHEAPAAVHDEMRVAFYAGAHAFLISLEEAYAGAVPTAEELRLLSEAVCKPRPGKPQPREISQRAYLEVFYSGGNALIFAIAGQHSTKGYPQTMQDLREELADA